MIPNPVINLRQPWFCGRHAVRFRHDAYFDEIYEIPTTQDRRTGPRMQEHPILDRCQSAQQETDQEGSPGSVSAFASAKTTARRSKPREMLTVAKMGMAWEKVRRVVRDSFRQRGRECVLCRLYGSRIDFQLSLENHPVILDREGDCIVARSPQSGERFASCASRRVAPATSCAKLSSPRRDC